MNKLKFDLMRPVGGGCEKFIATMSYPHNPIFKFDINDFYDWICDKRPSLKGKPISCYFNDGGMVAIHFNI